MTAAPRRAQTGIALVLVLWLIVLLTVIASGFVYSMHTEALAARNAVSLAQARAIADGAVMRVAFDLMRPRTINETWQANGAVHVWSEADARIAANAIDESGKIDLNAAPDPLLRNLFQVAGGLDADTAARLVDASRTVLLAIPGATAEVVDLYLAQRRDALAAGLPLPAFPVSGGQGGVVSVWRIRAEVTMPDATTYIREAVVRPGGDALHPLTTLAWQEGDQPQFPAQAAR